MNFVLAQQPYSKEVKLYNRYSKYDYIDFYISFHADAHSNTNINGISFYHWINSTKGIPLANCFAKHFRDSKIEIKFKKVDEADTDPSDGTYDNIGILREPKSPGLLIEHGYMTNDLDRKVMSIEDTQIRFAKLWADASVEYLIKQSVLDKSDLSILESSFPDGLEKWAVVPREWVINNQISDGSRPNDIPTRQEIWTMLYNYDKKKGE